MFKPPKPTYFTAQWETQPIIYQLMDHHQESSSPQHLTQMSIPRVHRILVCFMLLAENIRDWVAYNMQKLIGSQFSSLEGPRSTCQHLKRAFLLRHHMVRDKTMREDRKSLNSPLLTAPNPPWMALPSQPNHLLKITLLNTVTMIIKFQRVIRRGQIFKT